MSQIPLNAAASIGDNNRQATSSLPPEVIQCLENARFVRAHHTMPPPRHPHITTRESTHSLLALRATN